MKKSRLFGAVSVIISTLFSAPSSVLAVTINDGGTHTINYPITDGLNITNAASVNLEAGANISGPASYGTVFHSNTGDLNVNGGVVQGELQSYGSNLNISDGTIEGRVYLSGGGTATISGGTIDSIFSEGVAHVGISDGNFGEISTISGSYDITGGVFSGLLDIGFDRVATIDIKGGSFSSGFNYWGGYTGELINTINYTFFGNLSLTAPQYTGFDNQWYFYETFISGTLMDGTAISQRITCGESSTNNVPCGGVSIVSTVPIPPAVWLFFTGLLGLVGIARRKA